MRLHTSEYTNNALLIDEAHRLVERVNEMLCCELSLESIAKVLKVVEDRRLSQHLLGLSDFMTHLADRYLGDTDEQDISHERQEFWERIAEILEITSRPQVQQETKDDDARAFFFSLHKFMVAQDRFTEQTYFLMIQRADGLISIHLRCVDPSSWIAERVEPYRASVRFSATLSPPTLFDTAHGLTSDSLLSSSTSLHERLGVFVIPEISTYYRHRSETLSRIASIVRIANESTEGNWLVAMPSFDYLELVESALASELEFKAQTRIMGLEEREVFVEWVNQSNRRIGLVVMGGVFTESIDYDSTALMGVIVVGPAIPPQSLELEKIRANSTDGFELAYRLPAMTRVIQAAGRVVRGETDRGVVILIDPRFTRQAHTRYFPPHWQPEVTRESELEHQLAHFWSRS